MEEKTEEILIEKIKNLEGKLSAAGERISELEERVRGSEFAWLLDSHVNDDETLPIPRLEIEWVRAKQCPGIHVARYRMVLAHLNGEVYALPMGQTTTQGRADAPWPPEFRGYLQLPYRDGAHIHHDMNHLGLRAFVRCAGRVEELSPNGDYKMQADRGYDHRRRCDPSRGEETQK